MQKNKRLKGIISVVLCVIMVITSIPFALAAPMAGIYDPIPYFESETVEENGVSAWWNDNGGISVYFPSAIARHTFAGAQKTIEHYILELVDLGSYSKVHEDTVLFVKEVTPVDGVEMQLHEITKGELANILVAGTTAALDHNRYNITITAVDDRDWFSEDLNTIVSDVPRFVPGEVEVFSNSNARLREMLRFENKGIGYGVSFSNTGRDAATDDYVSNANGVSMLGMTTDTGAMVGTDRETSAYGFRIKSEPTAEGFTFDTTWSRQQYDFSAAKEIWFWMDLTDVELEGLSFRLRANEKLWYVWDDTDRWSWSATQNRDMIGDIVYSTAGTAAPTYKGATPYVILMKDNGMTEKVYLTDNGKADGKITGTLDLNNYRGYIRIPMEFMCTEQDATVGLPNFSFEGDCWKVNGGDKGHRGDGSDPTAIMTNIVNLIKQNHSFNSPIVVDPAGTSINNAFLLQHRGVTTQWKGGTFNSWQDHTFNPRDIDPALNNRMLAINRDSFPGNRDTFPTNTIWIDQTDRNPYLNDRAKLKLGDTTFGGREAYPNACNPADDLYSAGFAYKGVSKDSVNQNFYLDNVMFYNPDGGFDTNSESNTNGVTVETYYDQKVNVAQAILNAIDEYITGTSWAEYNGVVYVQQMINFFNGKFGGLFTDDYLNNTAASLQRADVWARYQAARAACIDRGTVGQNAEFVSNDGPDDLVPILEQDMEKFPDPTSIPTISQAIEDAIAPYLPIYMSLNRGQLDSLGLETEEKLIKYFRLLDQSVNGLKTGKMLADYPFIPFCDFEDTTDYKIGQKIWQVDEDDNAEVNSSIDYRRTKGINLSHPHWDDLNDAGKTIGYPFDKGRTSYGASEAYLTADGYMNSKGVRVNLDRATTSNDNGWHVVTVAKDAKDALIVDGKGRLEDNSMSSLYFGDMATTANQIDSDLPLSLVFYADFSEVRDFKLRINFFTKSADGSDKKVTLYMGENFGTGTSANWTYYILDKDGNWQSVQAGEKSVLNSGEATNNYRGYIMVPLYHMRYDYGITMIGGRRIDKNATELNNIYAIQFGFEDVNGTNDGKSFVIDNIGFAYDPITYPTQVAARQSKGVFDESYAKRYNAESTDGEAFENAVAAIDPYGDFAAFTAAANAADDLYTDLTQAQKDHLAVKTAHDKLAKYLDFVAAGKTDRPDTVKDVATLSAELKLLEGKMIETGNVTGDNDLGYPGIKDGAVNYAAYGFKDKTDAERVRAFYTENYKYYSQAEIAQLKADTDAYNRLFNSYQAAARCLEFENILQEADDITKELANFYHDVPNRENKVDGVDEQQASIARRGELLTIETHYNNLCYFAKELIKGNSDKDIPSAFPTFQRMPSAIERVLKNSKVYKINSSANGHTEHQGGLVARQKEYANALIYLKEAMSSNARLDNKASRVSLSYLRELVNEYNAFLPAYHNIEELYNGIWDIIDQFTKYSLAFTDPDSTNDNVTVNGTEATVKIDGRTTNKSVTVPLDISYVEEFDAAGKEGDSSVSYFKIKHNGGEITNADGITYTLTIGGKTITVPAKGATATTALTAAELGIINNAYNADNKLSLPITATFTATAPSSSLKDTVTIEHYRPSLKNKGERAEQLIGTYTLNIVYSEDDSYTVTIPASIDVPFNSTAEVTKNVNVTHNMVVTKQITVGLAAGNDYKMTLDTTGLTNVPDPLPELPYIANFGTDKSIVYAGAGASKTETAEPLKIKVPDWSKAYVNNYKDGTLTFVVSYGDKPTT